jgi:hypothetical protein
MAGCLYKNLSIFGKTKPHLTRFQICSSHLLSWRKAKPPSVFPYFCFYLCIRTSVVSVSVWSFCIIEKNTQHCSLWFIFGYHSTLALVIRWMGDSPTKQNLPGEVWRYFFFLQINTVYGSFSQVMVPKLNFLKEVEAFMPVHPKLKPNKNASRKSHQLWWEKHRTSFSGVLNTKNPQDPQDK